MAECQDMLDPQLERWMMTERWFMRYNGAALASIGFIGLFAGTLNNPDGELLVTLFNFTITVALLIGGLWTIWTTYDAARMSKLMDSLIDQPPKQVMGIAVIQIVVAVLFLLEGFNGRLPMLLLGLFLLTSALWFFRRAVQIRRFQDVA